MRMRGVVARRSVVSPNRLFRRSARKPGRSATAEATTGQGYERASFIVSATGTAQVKVAVVNGAENAGDNPLIVAGSLAP